MNKKTQPKISPIEKSVMDKIKKGEVHMKSQSYYIFLGSLSILSVLLLGLISAYFMSIATFWIRIQAAQGPAYGAKQNLSNMVGAFPWWALLLGILSLIGVIYLIKKIGPIYKVRLLYLIPLIVISFIVIGLIFSYSSLPQMFNSHRQNFGCTVDSTECQSPGVHNIRNK